MEEEEARGDRIFPNKSLRHGIRNRMYALRGQRARYSLVDHNDRSILYEDPRRDSNTSIEKKIEDRESRE